jgi:hypothetical protein
VTTLAPFVVHTAGAPVDALQRCVPCGFVLTDNTAWFEGRVAIPIGQDDHGPSWWPSGALVATDKNGSHVSITYVVDGRHLAPDEIPCT